MGNAIPDIPRIYTAIAEWLCCGMLVFLLGIRIKKTTFGIVSTLYFLALAFFMEITATITLWLWLPCMIVAFLSMVAFITYCSRTSLFDGVYYAIIAFTVAEGIASLEWQIVNSLYKNMDLMPPYIEIIILVAVYGLAICGVFLLFRGRFALRALRFGGASLGMALRLMLFVANLLSKLACALLREHCSRP